MGPLSAAKLHVQTSIDGLGEFLQTKLGFHKVAEITGAALDAFNHYSEHSSANTQIFGHVTSLSHAVSFVGSIGYFTGGRAKNDYGIPRPTIYADFAAGHYKDIAIHLVAIIAVKGSSFVNVVGMVGVKKFAEFAAKFALNSVINVGVIILMADSIISSLVDISNGDELRKNLISVAGCVAEATVHVILLIGKGTTLPVFFVATIISPTAEFINEWIEHKNECFENVTNPDVDESLYESEDESLYGFEGEDHQPQGTELEGGRVPSNVVDGLEGDFAFENEEEVDIYDGQ